MPGKVIPCALCATEAASLYCVNDDAHLCAACDASVHAANPLLARHERRPLSALACQAECASAAPTPTAGAPAASECTDGDACVVPCLAAPAAELPAPQAAQPAFAEPRLLGGGVGAEAEHPPAPLALYEDAFLGRSLTTSDLLDLDDLELPCAASPRGFAAFDPLDDCVVPAWGEPAGEGYLHSQQSSFLSQPYLGGGYGHPYAKQPYVKAAPAAAAPTRLVPLGGVAPAGAKPAAAVPQAGAGPLSAADAEAEAARVQRHRERQRKKRAFGRAVRYQSRRAYAEIRPRIKGRFVTPEEYAAYQAQVAAAEKAAEGGAMEGVEEGLEEGEGVPAGLEAEDAVVPQPPAELAAAPAFVAAA